jgi:hypothetical protein
MLHGWLQSEVVRIRSLRCKAIQAPHIFMHSRVVRFQCVSWLCFVASVFKLGQLHARTVVYKAASARASNFSADTQKRVCVVR